MFPSGNVSKGIVRCASSAETESGLEAYAGSYDAAAFTVTTGNDGFDMSVGTGVFGATITAPTPGEQIVWFNFDIRP